MKTIQKIRTSGLLVLALLIIMSIVSCQRAAKKASEKILEKAIENSSGNNADVDLSDEKMVVKTDDGTYEIDNKAKSWPGEIPADIPEFTYGKVKAVTTSTMEGTKTWNIMYEDVKEGFIDKYDAELKGKGFETITMKMGEQGGSISAESDKFTIYLMGGEGDLSLIVAIKKQE